jgi:hypothetical protein
LFALKKGLVPNLRATKMEYHCLKKVLKVDWGKLLMRKRRLKAEVMPIIKADVHTPIFCFPNL